MWRECHPTFQLTKHCDYRSRHQSVDDLTVIGSAALVAPATAGSTNAARTISAHLLTYGEQPSSVVTLERRYGPRWLRDDDDDDDDAMHKCSLCRHAVCVCVSVTFMSKRINLSLKFFSPSGSHTIVVFPYQTAWRYSDGKPHNGGVECRWVGKNRDSEPISGFTACC